MINGTLARYFSSGPLRSPDGVSKFDSRCSSTWWYHILYLNNIINDLFSDAPDGSVKHIYYKFIFSLLNNQKTLLLFSLWPK